jgi:hypothetical protein
VNEQTAKLLQKVSERLRDAPDIFFCRACRQTISINWKPAAVSKSRRMRRLSPCPQSPGCACSCDVPPLLLSDARALAAQTGTTQSVLTLSRHVSLLFKRSRHSRVDYRIGVIAGSIIVSVLLSLVLYQVDLSSKGGCPCQLHP